MNPLSWGAHGGILQGGADLAGAFLDYPVRLAEARERVAGRKRQEDREALADAFRAQEMDRADKRFAFDQARDQRAEERQARMDAREADKIEMEMAYEGLIDLEDSDPEHPLTGPKQKMWARGMLDRENAAKDNAARRQALTHAGVSGGPPRPTEALLSTARRLAEAEAVASGYGTWENGDFSPTDAVQYNQTLRRHFAAQGLLVPQGTAPDFAYDPNKILTPEEMSATFTPAPDAPYAEAVREQQRREAEQSRLDGAFRALPRKNKAQYLRAQENGTPEEKAHNRAALLEWHNASTAP
jgi:hypothetical protein